MSLQILLPLNGNLNNQGVSNVTITNNNSTVNNNGKIGKCYSFNGSNTHIRISMPPSMKSIKNSSIAVWVKSTSSTAAVGGISNDGGNNLACMTLFTNQWQFASGSAWKYINTGSFANTSIWHHLACTVDDTTIRTYMDGALVTSSTLTALGVGVTDITSSNFIEIGCDHPGGDEMLTGLVNDFRVYDHCLSAKEVKEISKGLVAHLRLDDFGPNPNEIANGMPYGSVSGYSQAGTGWSGATLVANSISPSGYVVRSTYTGSGGNSGGIHKQPYDYTALENGAVYTFSVLARASKTIPANIYNEMMTTKTPSMPVTLTTQLQHFIITGPINITSTYHSDIIYATGTDVTTNMLIEIYGLKLEKSSVATPLCPHTSDSQYFNPNMVIDSSGFINNGTFSSNKPSLSGDSLKYNSCMSFNGSNNFIACGRGAMVTDAITINIWGYASSWTPSATKTLISCTEGGGWSIYNASSSTGVCMGTGTSSNTYKYATVTSSSITSGWHMFTATYDGLLLKLYLDGVLKTTTTAYTTKTPIYYYSNNGIFIGAESGSNTTIPAGDYFSGNISDVRVYATALSDADVKDLYSTSASIANNGSLSCYELVEI